MLIRVAAHWTANTKISDRNYWMAQRLYPLRDHVNSITATLAARNFLNNADFRAFETDVTSFCVLYEAKSRSSVSSQLGLLVILICRRRWM